MFHLQDTEENKNKLKYFYKKQKQFLVDNNLQIRKKDYLAIHFYQMLTEKIQDKTEDAQIKELFAIACDILIRHCMTSRQYIQESDDTKMEYYSYAQFRIFNFGLKAYNRDKQNAFVYMTSVINNSFKQINKDDKKQKYLGFKQIQTTGIGSQITNLSEKVIAEFEGEYMEMETEQDNKINFMSPLFIQDIKQKYKQYKIKKLRILNQDESAPRFQRTYTEFDNFLEVKDGKGIVIEYIDIFTKNEDNGLSSDYYYYILNKAREHGHQTLFLFSDIYMDENISDETIFNRLDNMIKGIEQDIEFAFDGYLDYSSRMNYDPMLCYIPLDVFKISEKIEPIWFWIDEDRKRRGIPFSQTVEEYSKLKEKENGTRIYNCGMIVI